MEYYFFEKSIDFLSSFYLWFFGAGSSLSSKHNSQHKKYFEGKLLPYKKSLQMNLDSHKALSEIFEKQFKDKSELTVDWSIRAFLDFAKKLKGGLKTKAGNVLLCTYDTGESNLYLQIFFDEDGRASNMDIGYIEKEDFINVWEYYRNEKKEGFNNKFED